MYNINDVIQIGHHRVISSKVYNIENDVIHKCHPKCITSKTMLYTITTFGALSHKTNKNMYYNGKGIQEMQQETYRSEGLHAKNGFNFRYRYNVTIPVQTAHTICITLQILSLQKTANVVRTSSQWVLLQEVLKQSCSGVLHKMPLMRFTLCSFATNILLSAVWLLNVCMHSWPFHVLESQIIFVWTGDKVVSPVSVNFFQHNSSTLLTNHYIIERISSNLHGMSCDNYARSKTNNSETYRTLSPEI